MNILFYHTSQAGTQLSHSRKDLAKLQTLNMGFRDVDIIFKATGHCLTVNLIHFYVTFDQYKVLLTGSVLSVSLINTFL